MASQNKEDLTILVQNSAAHFGVDPESLKKQQLEAIISILREKDTFLNLPTGFGKSSFTSACRCVGRVLSLTITLVLVVLVVLPVQQELVPRM